MNVRVVGGRKTEGLRKLGSFKIFPEIIEIDDKCMTGYLKM